MNSNTILPIAVVIAVIATAGIIFGLGLSTQPEVTTAPTPPQVIYVNKTVSEIFEGTQEIKKISSESELREILTASSIFDGGFYDDRAFPTGGFVLEESLELERRSVQAGEPVPTPEPGFASDTVTSQKGSDGMDYSTTNVQVENVDEPDYLKNDAKYVYIVSQNTLSIIDAYPAESAKLVLKIALDIESQWIQNMFLNDDRLVIFYNGQSQEEIIPQFDFIPRPSYSPVTHALIVDVSDKENPEILKDYTIDGHFRDARMIGDYAYFVTNKNIDHQYPRLPIIMESAEPLMVPDAFYFDNVERFSNFNTLTAIDIFGDTITSETFLMGYSGTIYVSENNFYLTYQQNLPYGFYEESSRDRFFDVVVPLLPQDLQNKIKAIKGDSSLSSARQWTEISEVLQDSYNQMSQSQKENLFEKIRKALADYDAKIQQESLKTIIHKISIDGDKLEYQAKGSVPGRLLNQFSMDESNDRFRVATTTEYYSQYSGMMRSNAVYVLDEDLKILGGLDEIAPDESIFSARFIGDRLYLVTFQQIDPFFVIDLSSDTPKILGELKIPGFSNYLHPYDDDHVIGVGRDTKEIGNDRVQQLGVKVALFDVSDVSNPMVIDDYIIGDSSTHSEALNNHKAFFFDKRKNLLSIPISSDTDSLEGITEKRIAPDWNRWNGFYILDLDVKNGIDLKGTITHTENDTRYYGMGNSRTFYIEEILYTVSDSMLKMNFMNDLEEINSIKLENTGKFIEYLD
ncbi:MAG: beta-propeller domain-containing protein [Nitrosopumilaceae archaeon]|uniref:Beta-propeller domain-containing protein n=1 Tax=Candidatus Nitrosomaritimum aestuariumsis TaxID=3342354 RepID=A0AC60WA24_9ARCH|nr:beta-propeller domain-containing protein [Nitrosopumilaceae archaeon]